MTTKDTARQSEDSRLIAPAVVAEMLSLNVRHVLQLPIRRVVLGHRTIRYRKEDIDVFIREVTSRQKQNGR